MQGTVNGPSGLRPGSWETLGTLVDMVRDDDEGMWEFGAPPFDNLQPRQKLAVLAQVGICPRSARSTYDQTDGRPGGGSGSSCPDSIHVMVEIEIDEPVEDRESSSWRELVLSACRERGIEDLLDPDSEDLDEWEALIACLTEAILWDQDWKDADNHLDADPQANRVVKKLLGIDADYYVAVPPTRPTRRWKASRATLAGSDSQRFVIGNATHDPERGPNTDRPVTVSEISLPAFNSPAAA